jgi:hypothetical protein
MLLMVDSDGHLKLFVSASRRLAPGTKTQTQLTFGGFVEILWKHPNDTMFYGTTRDTPPAAGGKIAGIDLVGCQKLFWKT